MKNAKRFISMLLAVVMVFSVGSFELATVVTGNSTLNKAQGGTAASPQAEYSYSINSYLKGTTTPIIPAVTGTVTTSGYQLIAIAQIVPGYVLTPFESSPVRLTLTEPMTNVNFYYVAKPYTLSFQSNGGTAIDSITQGYKTTILKPNEPWKQGYVFTGWFTDGTLTRPVTWPYAMPLNGGTLFAGWVLAPVTLTFNTNNGTPISPVTASPGTLVQKPLNPTRNYYRFDGWYSDISYVQAVSWPITMPVASSTIYAKWTYVRYTITFNSTGGTSVVSIPAQPGDDVYPPDDPAKTGYSFDGWYYDNGTFANLVEWPMTMGDVGITLYAKWSPISVTISFNTDGGNAVAPLTALTDTEINSPEPPRKFGYVFAGWELNSSAYIFTTMPNLDITLVATWTASLKAAQTEIKTYKMVSGVLVPVTSARAGDIIYAVVTPKTNFFCGSSKFVLMYDSSFYTIVGSGKTAILPNASNTYFANAVASYSGQTTNLPSQWPATFVDGESSRYMYVAATFASNSKSPNGGYPLLISDTTSLFTVKLVVKADAAGSGNIFMDEKWDRSSTFNGTGASYFFYCTSGTVLSSSGISTIDFDTNYVDANKTITLDTSVPVFTNIFFNSGGGSPISAINGEAGTICSPPANPVREGYTFTNWLPAFPSVFPQTDLTITAQWQINSYNAYFMVDGTQYAKIPTQYGAQIIKPASNPVKVGWTFIEWSPTVGTMGALDKTFTALFTINSYKATFYVDSVFYREVTVEFGTQIPAPSNPQKTGCTFTTWSPALGVMGAANQSFNAQFSTNHYNAYFMADGQIFETVSTLYNTQIIAPAINPEKAGFAFTGWLPLVGVMGAAEQTFTAQWKSTIFNAYFKVDGEPYHTSVTTVGENIVLPSNPQKVGYTFNGWDNVPSPMPENNVTINATWLINKYNVTFKVEGGYYNSNQTEFGAAIALPIPPSKVGFTFSGWANIPAKMPAQDLILNAVFTANTYLANFMVDGVLYKDVSTLFGAEIVTPANPTKTGYTFINWLDVPATMPANNVTIQASFSINSYSAQFIVDSVNYGNAFTAVYGTAIPLPAAPTKLGYTFAGWEPVPSTMPDYNIEFNAVFTKNIHKATFMVDGVTYGLPVDTGYGDPIELPAVPSKTGYSFIRWDNLPDPNKMPDENVTMTAIWSINSYDSVFNVDGIELPVVTTVFGAAIKLPTAPTKAGVYFGGWSPTVPAAMPANTLYFTALWVTEAHNVTFYVDGVQYGSSVLTGVGAPVVAPATNPTKAGFLFSNWSPSLASSMPAHDVAYNAVFTVINNITVSFNLNGGTGTVPVSQIGMEGASVTLPARGNIAKIDYIFLGWATTAAATTALTSYAIPAASTTLFAVWNMLGDVNFSGSVNVTDALWVLQAASVVRVLTPKEKLVADITGEGNITITDALKILQYSSGILPHFITI